MAGAGRTSAHPLVPTVATLLAVTSLFLLPYAFQRHQFPIGYDAPYYVTNANRAAVSGLSHIRTIRIGSPPLLAAVMRATGQNAMTVVAWLPAVLAAIGALGAAAMARTAFGMRASWMPVVGFLTWAAFGLNSMLFLHLDNLLNAALTLCGFAAALCFVANGRGRLAATIMLVASGLAHWPFFAFSLVVYATAVAVFGWPEIRAYLSGRSSTLRPVTSLLAVAGASLTVVAATLPALGTNRFIGLRLRPELLKTRFLTRLREHFRYYALPLTAVGATAGPMTPVTPERRPARRFFISIMATWMVVAVSAGVAQLYRYPTAGARLINDLFPLGILAGVATWWGARTLAARILPGTRTPVSVVIALLVVSGFAVLTWHLESGLHPTFTIAAAREAAEAGAYANLEGPGRPLIWIRHQGVSFPVMNASLPASVLDRTTRFDGSQDRYLRSQAARNASTSGAVVVVLHQFNPEDFDIDAGLHPERVVAPGLFVLTGPVGHRLPPVVAPIADPTPFRLLWIPAVMAALFLVVGRGWSVVLLPSADPVVAVALAPGLGLAVTVLLGVLWDSLGIPVAGPLAAAPLIVAGTGGWALARRTGRRRRLASLQYGPGVRPS